MQHKRAAFMKQLHLEADDIVYLASLFCRNHRLKSVKHKSNTQLQLLGLARYREAGIADNFAGICSLITNGLHQASQTNRG